MSRNCSKREERGGVMVGRTKSFTLIKIQHWPDKLCVTLIILALLPLLSMIVLSSLTSWWFLPNPFSKTPTSCLLTVFQNMASLSDSTRFHPRNSQRPFSPLIQTKEHMMQCVIVKTHLYMFYFSVKKQYTSKKQVEAVVSVNGQMGWTICPYKPDV